jgi:hypothetical protein
LLKNSSGAGGRGGNHKDRSHYSAGAAAQLLAKTELLYGQEETCSATSIQVEGQGGVIVEHSTQDAVEQTIFSEVHGKQYTMAREAPICNNKLFQDFGYTANTPASQAVLDKPMWPHKTPILPLMIFLWK